MLISTEEGGYILICNIVACAFPQILDNSLISVLPWDGSRFLESHYSDSPVKCRKKMNHFFFRDKIIASACNFLVFKTII